MTSFSHPRIDFSTYSQEEEGGGGGGRAKTFSRSAQKLRQNSVEGKNDFSEDFIILTSKFRFFLLIEIQNW